MKHFYMLITCLAGVVCNSQIINFPDPLFKQALLEQSAFIDTAGISTSSIDINGNGEIELSEALSVRSLAVIYGFEATDLTGIESFANVTDLIINNISATSVDISSLHLQSLQIGYSPLLAAINFDGSALNTLHISNLGLTSIDLSSLASNTTLGELNLSGNHLTQCDLSPLAGHPFSIVDLSYNDLTSIDLTQVPIVQSLYLQHNSITSFDFSQINYDIYELDISENPANDLDLTGLDYVNYFFSGGADLHSVRIGDLHNFYRCYLMGNNISLLDFKNGVNESCFSIYTTCQQASSGIGELYTATNPNQVVCVDDFPSNMFDEVDKSEENYFRIILNGGDFGPNPIYGPHISSYCSFAPGGGYNTVAGNVTLDCGNTDQHIQGTTINIADAAENGQTSTNQNGSYTFYAINDGVTVTPQIENASYFNISPPSYTYNFTSSGNTQTGDFCLTPNGVHPDVEVSFFPITNARPGFDAKYFIAYKNKGNQTQSGSVSLNFNDALLNFVSASVAPDTQPVNALNWNFSALNPFESRYIIATFHVNAPTDTPPVNIGDVLDYTVSIASPGADETPDDNTLNFPQITAGSFDPNDKVITEGAQVDMSHADDYLHYIVNFQNTGTAAAENVVVKDILDANLDWNTMEVVGASHPYRSTLKYGNVLEFFFEGIDLPASASNEAASHGYIAFKIKPKSDIAVGTTIRNSAKIYFDFNFPIVTNMTQTTFSVLKNQDFTSNGIFKLFPNPADDVLNIEMPAGSSVKTVQVYDMLGQLVKAIPLKSQEKTTTTDIRTFPSGSYFVKVVSANGESTQKFIKK